MSTKVDSSRLLALDGVRAVAITLVLVGHVIFHSPKFRALGPLVGEAGVSIFLVLSGFLVTRVMLLDERKTGRLRLGRFYRRRALRILPAFYVFLAGLALLSAFELVARPDSASWVSALLYLRNWIIGDWNTGHLWSLSLEEQFYLIWPALFLVLRTRRRRLVFIGLTVVALTAWREYWLVYYSAHASQGVFDTLHFRTDMRFDTFLIGAAFAIADWKWPSKLVPRYVVTCILIWYILGNIRNCGFWTMALETILTAGSVGALLLWLVQNPRLRPALFLSRRSIVFIGQISYSIYLWQQPFLGPNLKWWSIGAVAACALASYWLVEKPALRWKEQLEKPAFKPVYAAAACTAEG